MYNENYRSNLIIDGDATDRAPFSLKLNDAKETLCCGFAAQEASPISIQLALRGLKLC